MAQGEGDCGYPREQGEAMTPDENQHLSLLLRTVAMHVNISERPYSNQERLEHVRLAVGLLRQAESMLAPHEGIQGEDQRP